MILILDLVHQNTDLLYEPENEVINIEINYNYYNSIIKNTCYIANLILRQTNKGKNYKPFKQIFQINLDNYDLFKQGKFIYKSSIIENKYHIKRDEIFTIIDINLDFLSTLEYTHIKDLNEMALQWLFYIFVCSNNLDRNTLYEENHLMRSVFLKMDNLIRDLNEDLYYNHEEFKKDAMYHQGLDEGKKEQQIEIAKKSCFFI